MKRLLYLTFGVTLLFASCAKENTTPNAKDARDQYVGVWSCTENSTQFGTHTFDITISKSVSDSTNVFADNFSQLGTGTKARFVINGAQVTIPSQSVSGSTYTGSGTLVSSSKLNLQYQGNDGQKIDNSTAVCTKK